MIVSHTILEQVKQNILSVTAAADLSSMMETESTPSEDGKKTGEGSWH